MGRRTLQEVLPWNFAHRRKIDLAAIKQAEVKMTGAVGEGMADSFDVEM